MGDVAMLQACVERLSREWPGAQIAVIADAGAGLAAYCPDATAVPRASGQPFARLFPARYRPVWQSVIPHLSGRPARRRPLRSQPGSALQAVQAADLVVAAGGGYLTDTWRWHATGVLGLLALAQHLGKPTAMFGQGIGPVRQPLVRVQARAVLPRLDVLSVREPFLSQDLGLSLGARAGAVTVTGDDALELTGDDGALDGEALGVNMRVAGYAGVDPGTAAVVGRLVARAAASWAAPVHALPVASADLAAIRGLFPPGSLPATAVMRDLTTPRDLARAAARCRAIVTGSYHAAVFGLAQGVPSVCVTRSPYYDAKFNGLRAFYPDICSVISLSSPDFADHLGAAIDEAWHMDISRRAAAVASAARQRAAGRAAYAQFRIAVEKRTGIIPAQRSSSENTAVTLRSDK